MTNGAPPWQLMVFSVSVRKREKWSWIRAALRRHELPWGRCLDVGCGVGTLSSLLRALGGSWTFIEPDEDAAREAEEFLKAPVRRATLPAARFPSAAFDCVTAFDVIEHLKDPTAFLAEVARVLAPGGMFVATTPSAGEGAYPWRTAGARWFGITREAHGHVVEGFSTRELVALVTAASLEVRALETFSRFFTEAVELAYNGAYHRANAQRQRTAGYNLALSPASAADVQRHAALLPMLRVVSPLLRGLSLLDRVFPLGPGYEVGLVAERPLAPSGGRPVR